MRVALAFGRRGAILGAFAGAFAIVAGGATACLTMQAAAIGTVCVVLRAMRRHILQLACERALPRRGEEPARRSS
ncbi:hypothetical protein [Burkholderia anthina]|uniref:hypothetical protein n=1 Tax=Burkholderia anthina TaxID=179879 RepID=UPI00158B07D9